MLSPALLSLLVASFGIGTTEFIVMGLLPDVAHSLGVTIPRAGLLVSGYAMGVVVGAPLMVMATARLARKRALLLLVGMFAAGNLACALAPGYGWLMLARVLTAFAHGAFFGIGSVAAADLVPARRAQAIAVMMTGLTLANVLGVPFGTFLGQETSWRVPFLAVSGIGLAGLGLIAAFLPATLPNHGDDLWAELRALRNRQVALPMLLSTLASVSMFTTFTYVTPFLERRARMPEAGVAWALLLFGAGLTAGNVAGGRFADRSPVPAVVASFGGTALLLVAFRLFASTPLSASFMLAAWGALVFFLVPPIQIWIVDAAREAPSMAASLNHSAFNLGNATGAWLGGVVIGAGYGYGTLPWVSAAVSVAAMALAAAGGRTGARFGARSGSPARGAANTPAP